jgi:hypothetical protein
MDHPCTRHSVSELVPVDLPWKARHEPPRYPQRAAPARPKGANYHRTSVIVANHRQSCGYSGFSYSHCLTMSSASGEPGFR